MTVTDVPVHVEFDVLSKIASKRNGSDKIILQYQKVDEILCAFAPSEDAATSAASFKAMIDELYELQKDGIKNIYTGLPAIRYLEKSSDYFSDAISVIRARGVLFNQFFGKLRFVPSTIIEFILEYGECNNLRDGTRATESNQKCQVTFGCCGRAYTDEIVNGVRAPKSMYMAPTFSRTSKI
jgi:hypothetical protein